MSDWRDEELPEGTTFAGDQFWLDMADLIAAVNGFVYTGTRIEAIIDTVRYFRANPDTIDKLLIKVNPE